MDVVKKYRKNCYNFSDFESIINPFEDNSTDFVLDVLAYGCPPDAYYTFWNATHYEWCGPMLMIIEYFAKFTKTK